MARRAAIRQRPNKGGGELRIIGGQWRSRKLPVANLPGLRPTSDRVRETLFNWLMPYVPGARVLDCFSGTGALALESLSRGAKEATLLEAAAEAASLLGKNLTTLQAKNARVIRTDSLKWLQQAADKAFDLIFLDPPFRQELLEETCRLLNSNGYIHSDSLIYIEVEKELSPLPVPSNWTVTKTKTAGQLSYYLLSVE
ncbi:MULTISPECIES: 16S rRNA (guanine(966)-N(2))-methyltransferase RsmD [unclassified Endozoicomonas]|uniref:16S rRNA (guanine(966)-N(2))-methyltransferase RsmD n=1 Tax=unclassified Endozoicomonas TaxID=2644528 RepID=UPI002147BA98|nr:MULTISPECIES: 16S rRNA (guanine(966)-N(2))-methyltransferase RsmD [unclassified Endozoicomonas]